MKIGSDNLLTDGASMRLPWRHLEEKERTRLARVRLTEELQQSAEDRKELDVALTKLSTQLKEYKRG